jgi:hypothetical protein
MKIQTGWLWAIIDPVDGKLLRDDDGQCMIYNTKRSARAYVQSDELIVAIKTSHIVPIVGRKRT